MDDGWDENEEASTAVHEKVHAAKACLHIYIISSPHYTISYIVAELPDKATLPIAAITLFRELLQPHSHQLAPAS